MPPKIEPPSTSVLLIDTNDTDRSYFVTQLKDRSPDYKIQEAIDGEAGLTSAGLGGLIASCSHSNCLINRATRCW